jgi:rhodanese-related sulfurtransferase/DNA-binding HxlR family transcriptional regulator
VAERAAKDALYAGFASVAKALGNGRRAEIVDVLAQGERSVDALSREVEQSTANTSQHLQVLARAGLVRTRREGTSVLYRLASDDVASLWEELRGVAATHLAEVEVLATAYVGDRSEIERISAPELAERLAEGRVTVLDVRPRSEYAAAHIQGAIPVPLDEVAAVAETIPVGTEVVAYCRGPYCVYADDAVRLLRARGVTARRLDTGLPAWRRAGYPVAVAG